MNVIEWGSAIADSVCMANKIGFRPQMLRATHREQQANAFPPKQRSLAAAPAHVLPVALRYASNARTSRLLIASMPSTSSLWMPRLRPLQQEHAEGVRSGLMPRDKAW